MVGVRVRKSERTRGDVTQIVCEPGVDLAPVWLTSVPKSANNWGAIFPPLAEDGGRRGG